MRNLTNTISKVSKHFYQNGKNIKITSGWWETDPAYPKVYLPHVGYDYVASVGTPLVAPFDGEVIFVRKGLQSTYGRYVSIYNGTHTFHIAHLSRVDVDLGQKLIKGQLIGLSGRSGTSENMYDAHVHAGIAKGRLTDVGIKGADAGDVWIDLEEYNFESAIAANDKVDYWRKQPGIFELTEDVNERSGYSTSSELIKTHKKGTKLRYTQWANSNKYTWLYLENGNYIAFGERGVENYGIDHEDKKAVHKPTNIGRFANMSGDTWLFAEPRKDHTYANGKLNASQLTTSLLSRSAKILEEANGRVKVRIPNFNPEVLWIANSQISVTDKAKHEIR